MIADVDVPIAMNIRRKCDKVTYAAIVGNVRIYMTVKKFTNMGIRLDKSKRTKYCADTDVIIAEVNGRRRFDANWLGVIAHDSIGYFFPDFRVRNGDIEILFGRLRCYKLFFGYQWMTINFIYFRFGLDIGDGCICLREKIE